MKNYSNLDQIIAGLRQEYHFGKLEDHEVAKDPLVQFANWFEEALESKDPLLNKMALATAAKSGQPSARVLLLKGFSAEGFLFFSPYQGRKGKEIKDNPRAEAVIYWHNLERQIRISGRILKAPRRVALNYFCLRPRAAQIGAWLADQSKPISTRQELERLYQKLEKKFEGKKQIPLPSFWGGYLLRAETYEFWQGRENRLNDRIFYKKTRGGWKIQRLQP